ncbi:MAG: relaxase/mobilization nuclease domain-containing protein [Alistipes sp.]|nr:relaxase/mobilization nuclease domain-containing protein [Alistipes sp.]
MIGNIVQGADFRGVVNYVLQKPDAEPLGSRGLRNDSIDHIVDCFRMQASLNPIAKPVAHISLDFSVKDKERLTNRMMMQIADEYLRRMGYGNTQVLIVRHHDREHPHLHLVINRIDNDGRRISDKNERVRNAKICRELSEKYGLYIAPNKERVKRHRLREPDKTKYEIYDAIRNVLPRCRNWNDLTTALRKQGINTEFKRKGSTSTIEGVKFSKNGYTFSGSKVDKAFSYSKLNRYFAQAQLRVSQQPTPGKKMKMAADNYRSAFSGLFGDNNPNVSEGANMGAYGAILFPPMDSPIKLSAAQLQRRAGESPEEHLARVTALLNQVAEAMAIATEEHKRRLRNSKPKKSTLKL